MNHQAPFLHYVLSSLIWKKNQPLWFQYSIVFISQFQILFTFLWIEILYLFELTKISLSEVLSVITGIFFLSHDELDIQSTNIAIIWILAVVGFYFVTMFFLWTIFSGFFFKGFEFDISKTVKVIIRYWAQIHHEIVFWFINIILSSFFSQGILITPGYLRNNNNVLFTSIAIILLIINYISSFLFAIFSFDPFRNNNTFACNKTTFQILTFVCKALMTSLPFFLSNSEAFRYILFLTNFLAYGARHYILIRNYPYFHHSAMKLMGFISTTELFMAFSQCLLWFLPFDLKESILITSIGQFLFLLMSLKIFSNSLEAKVLDYLSLEIRELRTDNQVQKKLFSLFYVLENTQISASDQKKLSHTRYFLYLMSSIKPCDNHMLSGYSDEEQKHKNYDGFKLQNMFSDYYYDMAIETLLFASKHIEKTKTNHKIELAHLVFERRHFYPKTIYLLASASKDSISFHQKVKIFEYTQYVQKNLLNLIEKREEGALDFRRVVDFEKNHSILMDQIFTHTGSFINLWNLFFEADLSLKTFVKLSCDVERDARTIEELWKKLERSFGLQMISLYPVYSIYLLLVRNALYSSAKINEKYEMNKNIYEKDDHSLYLSKIDLGTNSIILEVIMSKERLGIVDYCSENIASQIGWQKEEVIGKNISYIMPPYVREKHQKILNSTLENLDKTFFNQKVSSFVRTSQDFLKPCTIITGLHPYIRNELIYLGMIKTHKYEYETIVLDEEGYICSFTKGVAQDLGLANNKAIINIIKVCPFFQKKIKKVLKNCGLISKNVFPLSQCIIKVVETIKKNEEIFKKVQGNLKFQTDQLFVVELSFISLNGEKFKKYLTTFEARAFEKSFVIFMNLFEEKIENLVSTPKTEKNLFEENEEKSDCEDEEHKEYDQEEDIAFRESDVEELIQLKMEKLNNMSLLSEIDRKFTHRTLIHKEGGRKYEIIPNVAIMNSGTNNTILKMDTPLTTLDRFPTQIKINDHYETYHRQGKERFQSNNQDRFCSPGKTNFVSNNQKSSSEIRIPGSKTSRDKYVHEKVTPTDRTPRKIMKVNKRLNPGASASQQHLIFSLNRINERFENAVYSTPKDEFLQKFDFVIKLFLLVCFSLLIVSQVNTNSQADQISNHLAIIQAFRDRFHELLNLWDLIDSVKLIESGLIQQSRFNSTDPIAQADEIRNEAKVITAVMQNANMKVVSIVDLGEEEVQSQILKKNSYSYSLVNQDQIVKEKTILNDFNAIGQVVRFGHKLAQAKSDEFSSIIDVNHPFFDEVMTYSLLLGDQLSDLTKQICRDKISLIFSLALYLTLILGIIGLAIFLAFIHNERKSITKRDQVIYGLLRLDENLINEHIYQTTTFYNNLKATMFDKDFYNHITNYAKNHKNEKFLKEDRKYKKKNIDRRGINVKSFLFILFLCVLLAFILSTFFILLIFANNLQSQLSNQIEQYLLVDEYHLKIDLLQIAFYSLIARNSTTYLKSKPIEEEWERLYEELRYGQFYFSDIFTQNTDSWGQEQREYLKKVIQGDLCSIGVDLGFIDNTCRMIADRSFTRGFISVNNFILNGLRKAKEVYVFSNRSAEAIRQVFEVKDFLMVEQIKEPSVTLVYYTLAGALAYSVEKTIKVFTKTNTDVMISYVVVYMMLALVVIRKFVDLVKYEREKWRKLMRYIPHQAFKSNKFLLQYLINSSNKIFTTLDDFSRT